MHTQGGQSGPRSATHGPGGQGERLDARQAGGGVLPLSKGPPRASCDRLRMLASAHGGKGPLFSPKKDHLISAETKVAPLSTARAVSARLRAGRTFAFAKTSPHQR
jgi:hypothetical protein